MTILFEEALFMIIVLSGLPLVASALTGFCVTLLQAVTQLQEQTITYGVKLLTLIGVLVLFGDRGVRLLKEFSQRLFESIGVISV